MMRRISPYGWGLLLAWVFCTFYLEVAGLSSARASLIDAALDAPTILLVSLPLTVTIACLVVAIALERRLGSPASHPILLPLATLACIVGSPLLYLPDPLQGSGIVLYCAGACATGFGSALLWLLWGEAFSRLPQEEAEGLALRSTALAVVLIACVVLAGGWWQMILSCLFIALSGLLAGARLWPRGEEPEPRAGENRQADAPLGPRAWKTIGRGSFGIFAACLFVCLLSLLYDTLPLGQPSYLVSLAVALGFIAVVGIASLHGPRRTSIGFLYRWMCPLLVTSFAVAVLVPPEERAAEALCAALSSRLAFCLITQIYFSRIAACGWLTPTQSFGWGWVCVHAGDLAGYLLVLTLDPAASLEALCMGSIIALVVTTMYVVNDPMTLGGFWGSASPVLPIPGVPAAVAEAPGGAAGAAPSDGAEAPRDDEEAGGAAPDLQQRVALVARNRGLTPRETEILALLAQGRSAPYIRDALIISKGTVTTHLKHIYRKLDVHSRQELIDLVRAEGPE